MAPARHSSSAARRHRFRIAADAVRGSLSPTVARYEAAPSSSAVQSGSVIGVRVATCRAALLAGLSSGDVGGDVLFPLGCVVGVVGEHVWPVGGGGAAGARGPVA